MQKYKTNWLLLAILLVLVLIDCRFILTYNSSLPKSVPIIYQEKEEVEKFGDLEVSYPKKVISFSKDIDDEGGYFTLKNYNFISDSFPKKYVAANFSITLNPNANPQKLDIQDWWLDNSFENERGAPASNIHEKISLSNQEAFKTVFEQQNSFGLPFYETVIIYLPYGTDIYEIRGYQLPENPDPALTPEDIKAAQEYEKIFNQMLQSIHFSD